MKWNLATEVDFWRKAETFATQTFLGHQLFGWEHCKANKLIVYLVSMQRLMPQEWKSLPAGILADRIIIWLATTVTERKADDISHILDINN